MEGDDGGPTAMSEDSSEREDREEPGHQPQPGPERSPCQQVLLLPTDQEVLCTNLAHHKQGAKHGPGVPGEHCSQLYLARYSPGAATQPDVGQQEKLGQKNYIYFKVF